MGYAFIAENRLMFAVNSMCRMLTVHPRGFYEWLREPFSQRALEDQRVTLLLKTAWEDSGELYGYRKLYDDLCPSCLMIFRCHSIILWLMRCVSFAVHWRGGSHPSWSLRAVRE